ncbi:MAG: YebC/PmpR family DNA-binding transcriptional regulator [Calditrichaeota bacterium]|nr:MAG: YebC/PmpR family DNA-binding transcriptional regulator [Calditrichota bacterium]
MAGHSKWKQIKHKKARMDAQRGKIFTKLIKEITVAARVGGGDENSNPRLRTAIQAAKAANMPYANIERAIKKGTGELPGVTYDEATYEGYGPGGTAIMVECLTDNKNRTVADIRHLFSKYGGNLSETGSVAWMFERKGEITVKLDHLTEDDLMMVALEAGAEDMTVEEGEATLTCAADALEQVKAALEENGITWESAEISLIPQSTVKVEGKKAEQLLKLIEHLEEHEDVQNVYSNFEVDAEILEGY